MQPGTNAKTRRGTTRSRGPGLGMALVLLALPWLVAPAVAEPVTPIALPSLALVAHDAPVLERKSYNYAPAIIRDGALYHLYWCAGVAGDYVLHAQAADPHGPWHGAGGADFDQALAPSGSPDRFDGQHACDPNVVKVGARFYLYYGGLPRPNAGLTAIGVAASDDAVHFTRLNGGAPIVAAAMTNPNWQASKLTYGAGQPAAVWRAPYVYLAFTDSTGAGANPGNGAGQFVLRSKDPSFATGVQEFTGARWENRPFGRHTAQHSIFDSFGIDWAFDPASRALIAVTDRVPGQSTVLALDPATFRTLALGAVPLVWREGPGLLALADKSMPPRRDCGAMDITVLAAAGASNDPFSWHQLHYSEESLGMGDLCTRRDP